MNDRAWEYYLGTTGYYAKWPDESDEILTGIIRGIDIGFYGERVKTRLCTNLASATVDLDTRAKVTAIILADVMAGKKAGPYDESPFQHYSLSPVGAVPKPGTAKIRLVNHLSFPVQRDGGGDSINANTYSPPVKLGSFTQACDAIRRCGRGCLLVKLDVEAAYKQVPVRQEDWPLLCFKWAGKYYYELCLPFGLTSSCAKWELYATALHHFFRVYLGIALVIHYIDDFLFVFGPGDDACSFLKAALALCVQLGLPMAVAKTIGPTTRLTFLGIQLDTITMMASLDDEKLSQIRTLLHSWMSATHATVRELQSLCGKLNWCAQVVRPGRAYTYLRRIIDHCSSLGHSLRPHRLTASVHADVRWWNDFVQDWNGTSLLLDAEWTDAPSIELFTDACLTGFGAVYGRKWLYGRWSDTQLAAARNRGTGKLSVPYLELLAVVIAVATWGPSFVGRKLRLRSDCMPVVLSINRISSTIERSMHLIRYLTTVCARGQFDVRCTHIAGVRNISADALSRGSMQIFETEHMRNQPAGAVLETRSVAVQPPLNSL